MLHPHPNIGLFPVVTPIDEEHSWLMQLTGAERARLQETAVPDAVIDRVDDLSSG